MIINRRYEFYANVWLSLSLLLSLFDWLIVIITSSTSRLGMWNKLSNNFNFTWVCKSAKHSLILRNTSLFNWVQIEPLIHESFEVPSLLCSHSEVSLSRTFAIFPYTDDSLTCHLKSLFDCHFQFHLTICKHWFWSLCIQL